MAEQDQKNEVLFVNLVMTFQMAAWHHLGKIKNPMTDKIDRNLEQARFAIDMLEIIRTKTAGNLTDSEKRMMDHTLSELQMNYVDEVEKEKKTQAEKPKNQPESEKKDTGENKSTTPSQSS